jgi:hypothetical protein
MLSDTVPPTLPASALSNELVRWLLAIGGGLLVVLLFLAIFVLPPLIALRYWRGRVRQRGYSRLRDYLRDLPQTEEEKLDAIELTLKGVVICALGLLFPPLILFGLVPLYYGARKLAAVTLTIGGSSKESTEGPLD